MYPVLQLITYHTTVYILSKRYYTGILSSPNIYIYIYIYIYRNLENNRC